MQGYCLPDISEIIFLKNYIFNRWKYENAKPSKHPARSFLEKLVKMIEAILKRSYTAMDSFLMGAVKEERRNDEGSLDIQRKDRSEGH